MLQLPEIISTLADTERRIEAFASLDGAVHRRSYAPNKWNGLQILGHVSDVDAAFYYRFISIAAQAGAPLIPFDETLWATELRIDERPAPASVAVIKGVHAGMTHQLRTLSEATLARTSQHPQFGPISPLRMASVTAGHTLHHVNQLEAIRDGRSWTLADKLDYWN